MKKLNVYIDYSGTNEGVFSENLKSRIKNIDGIDKVLTYSDLKVQEVQISEDEYEEDWEKPTIDAIKKADITIVVLSELYLDFVSEDLESEYDKIIESNDKYLFTFLYTPSEWGSHNWVVKSKLYPLNGTALSEHTETESSKVTNDFVKTIKAIVRDRNSPEKKEVIVQDNQSVFISHDHDDADFAELLKLKLEKHSINSWIDTERLKIGQDWRQEIDDGIQNSIAVIAIMTPEARKSEYVTYEWAFAWGKSIKVFPIMLKQTQLHPRLESLQYLDFTNRSARPWTELIDSIKEILK
ncbi:toll/interleukin-1 receptor domain-containing protein [Flavicella sediminum]|uniref:toll/interleukin-1 receptor domain-containing protein n=1 Tax=Flavicella sediminum TaxID=2585141 RepID=UPI00111C9AF4|nr:toll/interleukin-1 receptor domain-containing protein [Flavicella sediminum]